MAKGHKCRLDLLRVSKRKGAKNSQSNYGDDRAWERREGNLVLKYFLVRKPGGTHTKKTDAVTTTTGTTDAEKMAPKTKLGLLADRFAEARRIIDAQQKLLEDLRVAGTPHVRLRVPFEPMPVLSCTFWLTNVS
jgi:hypothetical protein